MVHCYHCCWHVGQESGGVDFRTLGNQTAARVLEEVSPWCNECLSTSPSFSLSHSSCCCSCSMWAVWTWATRGCLTKGALDGSERALILHCQGTFWRENPLWSLGGSCKVFGQGPGRGITRKREFLHLFSSMYKTFLIQYFPSCIIAEAPYIGIMVPPLLPSILPPFSLPPPSASRVISVEKGVVILRKKTPGTPFFRFVRGLR